METVFNYLKGLSASQRLMWFGNIMMVAAGLSTGVFGYQVAAGMHLYVFGAGAIMSLVGWYGAQQDAKRLYDLKMEDAKLREKKLDKGLDPALDKTIIRTLDQ